MTNKNEIKTVIEKITKKTMKDDLIKQCVKLIGLRIGNRKIQKDILRHYKLGDDGRDLVLKNRGINKANGILARLDVSVTGAKEGDIVEGTSVLTRNSILKIGEGFSDKFEKERKLILKNKKINNKDVNDLLLNIPKKTSVCQLEGFIYPEKRNLDTLRRFPSVWKQFLQKLGSLIFFQDMTKPEREEWLYVNEESTHNSRVVGDDNYLQILQPGGIDSKLDEDTINKLMKGKNNDGIWTGKEIEKFFPKVPGSKANKHTLFLIRSFWRINVTYKITNNYVGNILKLPFNTDNNKKLDNSKLKTTTYVLRDIKFKNKSIENELGIKTYANCDSVNCISKVKISDVERKTKFKIKNSFGNLPPSFYKSLIQKIIRFRPKKIKFPEYMNLNNIDSELVLISSVLLLAELSGSFVPDIQRYVTGKEACFKRLAVSIVEDGYTNENNIATLFTSALLSQRVKSWNPNLKIYDIALKTCRDSLKNNKYFGYSIRNGNKIKPFILKNKQSAMERSSSILDELKSFSTDIDMLRDCVDTDIKNGYDTRPNIMYLEQSVDHHWATGITYFMDKELVEKTCTINNSKTFAPLFSLIWKMSSGVNVRKTKLNEKKFNESEVVQNIRKAQELYLLAYHGSKKKRKTIANKKYDIKYELNDGWLASLIGSMDVGLKPPSLVTVNPENITKFIAIRRPSRDHNEILTEQQKTAAINKAKEKLKKGISLSNASSPIPDLNGAKVKLIEKNNKISYVIMLKDKTTRNWDDIKSGKQTFSMCKSINNDMKTILTNIGNSVEENHKTSFDKLMKKTDIKILRRVIYYLSGYNAEINMNRIGRDGGGIVQSVIVEDVGAYQFLLQTSKIK